MKHGWLFDDPDPRDWDAKDLLRSPATRTKLASSSHMHVRAPRGYQQSAASCVGFALSRAIYMNLRLQGINCPEISEAWLYAQARLQEYAGMAPVEVPSLVDIGCYPALAMVAVKSVGFVSKADYPYVLSKINRKPTPAVAAKAYSQRGLKYYRIWDCNDKRLEQASEVMQRGHTIKFGMRVDQGFVDHVGEEAITHVDIDHAAGHGMTVLEIEPDGTVRVDNWWQGWGMADGTGRISPQVWGHPIIVPDVFVIEAAPEFVQ